jgi:hypothetical protein
MTCFDISSRMIGDGRACVHMEMCAGLASRFWWPEVNRAVKQPCLVLGKSAEEAWLFGTSRVALFQTSTMKAKNPKMFNIFSQTGLRVLLLLAYLEDRRVKTRHASCRPPHELRPFRSPRKGYEAPCDPTCDRHTHHPSVAYRAACMQAPKEPPPEKSKVAAPPNLPAQPITNAAPLDRDTAPLSPIPLNTFRAPPSPFPVISSFLGCAPCLTDSTPLTAIPVNCTRRRNKASQHSVTYPLSSVADYLRPIKE